VLACAAPFVTSWPFLVGVVLTVDSTLFLVLLLLSLRRAGSPVSAMKEPTPAT